MYSRILFFVFMWNVKITYEMDYIVIRGDSRIKSNIVRRSIVSDIPTIKEFIVKTSVANRFAETSVLSKVENVDKHAKQTTFSMVLPERAFISGFSMDIDGNTYKAFVKEKVEAEKIYGQSVASGQTAAHVAVSTRNSNRFTVNVNVEGQSKVNFHLTYEELLQREDGQYEIIANLQPGQIVKKLEVEVKIKENRPLLFVRTPSLRSGNVLVKNNTKLDPQAKVKISNTSAIVRFYPDVNRQLQFACAGLGNNEYDGFAGQFVVQYDIELDPQGGETIFQDGFFIHFFALPNLEPIPKHIVFVLDTSGSMRGTKITQLKDAMISILPQLYPEDLFSIVQFESGVWLWDLNLNFMKVIPSNPNYGNLSSQLQQIKVPEAVPATKENIEIAKKIINSFNAEGSTNTIGGLEVGLYLIKLVQKAHPDQYQPILIFLTDGVPYGSIDKPSEIISLITNINSKEYKTPIYSLCIGNDSDWIFLQELSTTSSAKPTRIYLDAANPDISVQLQNFYKTIGTPVLKNLTFNNLPTAAQLTEVYFPIFFNGSEITIAGKGVSGNGTKPIKISAIGKKGPLELEAKIGIPLTRLERVWAYLTVKQLLDASHTTGANKNKTELQKKALDMALNYSLVTDVTSLVVIKPNDTNTAINAVDASNGIFPQSPHELPMCNNITNWIITNFGTPQPTTMEPTTMEPTTMEPTTTEMTTELMTTTDTVTTTLEPSTTTEFKDYVPVESNFGITEPTILPTAIEAPVTEKIIKSCKDMPFGCCHDGITTAVGLNFSGCDPIPRSESCSLPESPGVCSKSVMYKYSPKWAYSSKLGECRHFWYTGCGGNDNRFGSKQDCERVCVNATGPDRCKLPVFRGNCAKYELSWFYDQKKDECVKFVYYGCSGNSNRFATKEECLQLCASPKKQIKRQDACSLPENKGTCRKFVMEYYFDIINGLCRPFWYGGCGGNENRYKTEEECKKVCINPDGQDVCQLPAVKGRCTQTLKRWHYNKEKKTCQKFVYGGCHGNKNNFNSREDCYKSCVSDLTSDLQESCFLNKDKGSCRNGTVKWAFSRKQARCIRFMYGGCDGNNNRFDSEEKCKNVCISPPGKDRCKLPKVKGTCQKQHTRWYYDKNREQCIKFVYTGCFGNSNNFLSLSECKKLCG